MLARARCFRLRRSRRDLSIAPPDRGLGGFHRLAWLKETRTTARQRAPCTPATYQLCQTCRVRAGARTRRTHGCGDLEEIFSLIRQMQEAVFTAGAVRLGTVIKIDDRRDRAVSMDDKVTSVQQRLEPAK